MPRLIFAPEADEELEHARRWCREAHPERYRQFNRALADAFTELAETPLRWARWREPDYRRRLLRPYPYAIIYHVAADLTVVVDALMHTSRDPDRRFPP